MAELLVTADPKVVPPETFRKQFTQYLEERCLSKIENILLAYKGSEEHCSLYVDFVDLVDFEPSLSYMLLNFPALVLPRFEEAILEAQSNMVKHPSFIRKHQREGIVKKNCHVRFISLPVTDRSTKLTINDINSDDDVSTLIQISGTIVRTGGVRMLEVSKMYECQNPRCLLRFTVLGDPEQDNMLSTPRVCPSRAGGSSKKCMSTNLREVEGSKVCIDYQEVKLQDKIERLTIGSVPRSIVVILEADMVDKFNAGDDVNIVGTILRQWKPVLRGARCNIDIAIKANSVVAMNSSEKSKAIGGDAATKFQSFWDTYLERPLSGRDFIIRSVCPQLFGMYLVKLCVLLTLVGGNTTSAEGGVRRRSQSHLLIIGEPGCGKSQLLRFAAATTMRSVLTTGIGTTGAGLTCTVVKDGNDWTVEAGALVLANEGLCCIDEFASIKENDRSTIHEAMEQQTLSVAKAGLLVKLHTRATVIACCNPKGTYDINLDVTTNTAIGSPLLSRFDLILVLLDRPNKDWDKRVSTYLLQQAIFVGTKNDSDVKQKSSDSQNFNEDEIHDDEEDIDHYGDKFLDELAVKHEGSMNRAFKRIKKEDIGSWSIQTLRQYISFVKHRFQPSMSAEAKYLLMKYYQQQRQIDDRSSCRTTVRLLESLMRLTEAHAKIMFRDTAGIRDAVMAILCVSLSERHSSVLDNTMSLQSELSEADSEEFYEKQEAKILRMLNLTMASLHEAVRHENLNQYERDVDFSVYQVQSSCGNEQPQLNRSDNVSIITMSSDSNSDSHVEGIQRRYDRHQHYEGSSLFDEHQQSTTGANCAEMKNNMCDYPKSNSLPTDTTTQSMMDIHSDPQAIDVNETGSSLYDIQESVENEIWGKPVVYDYTRQPIEKKRKIQDFVECRERKIMNAKSAWSCVDLDQVVSDDTEW